MAEADIDHLQLIKEKEALLQELQLISQQQRSPEDLKHIEEEKRRLEEDIQQAQATSSHGAAERLRMYCFCNILVNSCLIKAIITFSRHQPYRSLWTSNWVAGLGMSYWLHLWMTFGESGR